MNLWPQLDLNRQPEDSKSVNLNTEPPAGAGIIIVLRLQYESTIGKHEEEEKKILVQK